MWSGFGFFRVSRAVKGLQRVLTARQALVILMAWLMICALKV